MQVDAIVDAPLIDLGDILGSHFAGIFMPKAEIGSVPAGVTSQFLDDADQYHDRYFDTQYSEWLLQNAYSHLRDVRPDPLILDIGSGSGNTVFAGLKILPSARIIATDISPNLLSILKSMLDSHTNRDKITLLCLDLNKKWFKPSQFDLGVGLGILHHLFDPMVLISQAFTAIKPGGSLIFFEPFERGHAILGLLYQQIIDASYRMSGLEHSVIDFLSGKIKEMELQKCEEKSRERYANLDDKWMFTHSYFDKVADALGVSSLQIYPIHGSEASFKNQTLTALRLGLGCGSEALPDWAWALIDQAEARLSADLKKELLLEGCIIFTK